MQRGGHVYILTNSANRVLYTGVTSDLVRRVEEHRLRIHPGSFTDRYNCSKLVYYRHFDRIEEAIAEEKRIKAGSRAAKLALIQAVNPTWKNLWTEISQL